MPDENEILHEQELTSDAVDEIENDADEILAAESADATELQDTPPKAVESKSAEATLARVPWRKLARDAEPFDFERCTVLATLQLMPLRDGQAPGERQVFLSARTHSYPPFLKQMHWDELAPRLSDEINALLEGVKAELPRRAAEREALEEAERQRQAQLKAEGEKRRAANQEQASAANAKPNLPKRVKKVDLNSPPPSAKENSAPAAEPETPIKTEPSAQLSMF